MAGLREDSQFDRRMHFAALSRWGTNNKQRVKVGSEPTQVPPRPDNLNGDLLSFHQLLLALPSSLLTLGEVLCERLNRHDCRDMNSLFSTCGLTSCRSHTSTAVVLIDNSTEVLYVETRDGLFLSRNKPSATYLANR